ncbi:unnamed protein product [Owenia fusiformis]|uniref:Uncharacterized protein n=1 Tax=Owenia fusiformis TaxID=6347 RepID=A0A8J1TWN7_OWEFU|nr:unnamed protein product [Owenia fusiformis]
MDSMWPEVEKASKEKRHELVLSGANVSERIRTDELDKNVFNLTPINFLEISKTCLESLPNLLGNLVNLTSLVLHNNKLKSLPTEISQLSKLHLLDASTNEIESLPEEFNELTNLHTLNLNCNKLTTLPNFKEMVNLHVVMMSHNNLTSFPEGLSDEALIHLNTINLGSNEIGEIPDDLSNLPSLKSIDLSENKFDAIPPEMSQCTRIKEFNFKGNKLKDRRLKKLVEQGCKPKAFLDYLGTILAKQKPAEKSSKKKKGKKVAEKDEGEVEKLVNEMEVLRLMSDDLMTVQMTEAVANVRPYIVCCIVRNLNFQKTLNMFKHFITLQTKLHDTICEKRVAATIATHDLAAVKVPLKYDALPPQDIKIHPLFGRQEVSADELVTKLRTEAEAYRREKKRNTFSGIHKYLELLDGKAEYPCLKDSEDRVISFPPITNSDITKISKTTESILIEVTSSTDMHICKKVLDELLKGMLEMGCGNPPKDGATGATAQDGDQEVPKQLTVEQVRVLDTEGHLKVVYPSRTDLNYGSLPINVKRE